MGWTFGWHSKEALVAHLEGAGMAPHRLLKSVVKGSRHWFVAEYERKDGQTVRYIGLNLLQKSGGEWGYKDLDETMGPCEVDVPLAWLDLVPERPEYEHALAWRVRVRAHYARKATIPRKEAGVRVRLGGNTYTLEESLGRKGWRVLRADGMVFRMTARQAASAELVA